MQEKPKCVLCMVTIQENNIGFTMMGKYVCDSCERKIANLAWDDPDYDVYKSGLKKIWRCKEA